MSNCNKIQHIVRIQQMLKRWRRKAGAASTRSSLPSDVPAGHVAVCVGANLKRFIVRATHLNHPIFESLLVQAEEEFGFQQRGPLTIPCEENVFEELLRVVSRSQPRNSARFFHVEGVQRCCHVGGRRNVEFLSESRPLLRG